MDLLSEETSAFFGPRCRIFVAKIPDTAYSIVTVCFCVFWVHPVVAAMCFIVWPHVLVCAFALHLCFVNFYYTRAHIYIIGLKVHIFWASVWWCVEKDGVYDCVIDVFGTCENVLLDHLSKFVFHVRISLFMLVFHLYDWFTNCFCS